MYVIVCFNNGRPPGAAATALLHLEQIVDLSYEQSHSVKMVSYNRISENVTKSIMASTEAFRIQKRGDLCFSSFTRRLLG